MLPTGPCSLRREGWRINAFVSKDLDLWVYANCVTLDFSRPGKPTDNAYIEAFNGRFRAECLNANWFLTLADAAEKKEASRKDWNEVRPHGAIGQKYPISLTRHGGITSSPTWQTPENSIFPGLALGLGSND